MFDRAVSSLMATVAACAAVAVAVIAAGFALYALALPMLGSAGAAALVAFVAFLLVGLYAIIAHERAKAAEREAKAAHAALMDSVPQALGALVSDHPLVALGISLVGGAVAARHPQLARELVSLMSNFTSRRA